MLRHSGAGPAAQASQSKTDDHGDLTSATQLPPGRSRSVFIACSLAEKQHIQLHIPLNQ
jgi:hypothetical protein